MEKFQVQKKEQMDLDMTQFLFQMVMKKLLLKWIKN